MKTVRAKLWLLVLPVLFLNFSFNLFHIANQNIFEQFERYQDGWVVGRILQSRQHGLLSAGGLPGAGVVDGYPGSSTEAQFAAYRDQLPFSAYGTYNSSSGGAGILFSLLDPILPGSGSQKLAFFYALTALLSAAVLTLTVHWFLTEFNLAAGLFVFLSIVCSQWLIWFSHNLWFQVWSFYLPFLAAAYLTRRRARPAAFMLAMFASLLAKIFLSGFEYISTAAVVPFVPLVYAAIKDRLTARAWLASLARTSLAAGGAVLAGLFILCLQIGALTGRFADGVQHVIYSLEKRTYADPAAFAAIYQDSLRASPLTVLKIYLQGYYLEVGGFQLPYAYLILFFILCSLAVIFLAKTKERPLLVATWFSILAPLSWFIIFKSHSYIHTFINFIVWQMPFTLYGFALSGVALSYLAKRLRIRLPAPPPIVSIDTAAPVIPD